MRLSDRVHLPSIIVAGLCLLAFGLRVARLDFHPIWFDEDLAYQRATATLSISLASMAGSPLYYVLLRGWVQLAGVSLFALRYFSALWGTLTPPLVYCTTRCLLGNRMALATTAVTVVAPFYIYYSQEARAYTLTLVLMLLSMYAFLRWLDSQQGWTLGVCSLANLICLYTHYVAALVIVLQGVTLVLTRPVRWKDMIAFVMVQVGVGLVFLPWLLRVWKLLPRVMIPLDSTTPDAWSLLGRTWTEFSVGRTVLPPLSLYLSVVPLFLVLTGLLSLLGSRASRTDCRARKQRESGWASPKPCVRVVALVWLIVPIVGSLLVPRASVRFSPKYLIAITPVFYMLIVLGLTTLRKESRVLFWVCLVTLVSISLYSLEDYYFRQHAKSAGLPVLPAVTRAEKKQTVSAVLEPDLRLGHQGIPMEHEEA